MNQVILILLFLLAANLPWFSDKLFYLIPLKQTPKNVGWCLFELIVLYFVVGALGFLVEKNALGQVAPQDWEFYATTASLFLVFAFPGFVVKMLWKRN